MAIFFALTTGVLLGLIGTTALYFHLIETDQDFRNMLHEEIKDYV
jgi:hypothetical protein